MLNAHQSLLLEDLVQLLDDDQQWDFCHSEFGSHAFGASRPQLQAYGEMLRASVSGETSSDDLSVAQRSTVFPQLVAPDIDDDSTDWSQLASSKAGSFPRFGMPFPSCSSYPFSIRCANISAAPCLPVPKFTTDKPADRQSSVSYYLSRNSGTVSSISKVGCASKRNWDCSGPSEMVPTTVIRNDHGSFKPADDARTSNRVRKRNKAHMENERARRKKMSFMFDTLQSLLPGENAKVDRTTTVNKAISHIKDLEQQLKSLAMVKVEMQQTLHLLTSSGSTPSSDASAPEMNTDAAAPPELDAECYLATNASNTWINIRGSHATITLSRPSSKKGFLPTVFAALESCMLNVEHAYVHASEDSSVYIIHSEATDGKDMSKENLFATFQGILNGSESLPNEQSPSKSTLAGDLRNRMASVANGW